MPPEEQAVQPEATPAEPAIRSRVEIARELFGREYHEPEAKPVEEIITEEAKPADTQAGEEVPQEPTVEPEGATETAPAEDTGETPIETVSELVEHLGTSRDWFDTVKVPVNVDGTPTEATISDLVKSYQITTAAEHRLEDAKVVAKKESEAWAAKHSQIDTQFHVLADMLKQEEARLERDIKLVDPKLRDEDPAEWAARVQEFNQRRAEIAQSKSDAAIRYQSFRDQTTQEQRTIVQQFTAEQAQLLLHKLPEWQDTTKAQTEKSKIADYLLRTGFAPQELDNLIDHRHVLIARKAMLYDESRGQVETAKKKVATVPKIMKPGAPKPAEQRAAERIAALEAKMKRSGTMEDALAYRMAKRGVR